MTKESPQRRRLILSRLTESGVASHMFTADVSRRSQREARDECFKELVPTLLDLGVTRMVVETCDQDTRDRSIVGEALLKRDAVHKLHFVFMAPTTEPLLWVADAAAWSYGAGGDWRRRADPITESVTSCGA